MYMRSMLLMIIKLIIIIIIIIIINGIINNLEYALRLRTTTTHWCTAPSCCVTCGNDIIMQYSYSVHFSYGYGVLIIHILTLEI